MITVKGLTKRFDSAGTSMVALDDVSFEIKPNSFFTLLGPSGCGKSTLLRCIAGLEHPDDGEIWIGNELVFSSASNLVVPPNRRDIGMVFQSYAIWPHMSVGENVAFPLEVRKLDEIRRRVLDVLTLVGLGGLEDRPASKLSGGQQQRVALARAIVAEPKVLLLDEPLSNLDTALREQMRSELLRIQRSLGITMINVTHDQAEALSMSDRIAVMSKGRLLEIAAPRDLYESPQTAFVARFIGNGNLLRGTARNQREGFTMVETPIGPLLAAGDAEGDVEIFIRPESIRLAAGADAEVRSRNTIRCTIRAQRYIGSLSELDLMPIGTGIPEPLLCRLRIPEGISLDAVEISIDPAHVRILPAAK